jgi:hypothetical protein
MSELADGLFFFLERPFWLKNAAASSLDIGLSGC